MKAFRFPLESLRTLRQQRERTAQQTYARALVLCDGAQRVLQLAEEELKAGHAMLMSELKTGATASRFVNLRTWCTVLELRRTECLVRLAEARRHANEIFQVMTVISREREALDRFHDNKQSLWQRAFQADEQKMFDELAVQRQAAPAFEQAPLLN